MHAAVHSRDMSCGALQGNLMHHVLADLCVCAAVSPYSRPQTWREAEASIKALFAHNNAKASEAWAVLAGMPEASRLGYFADSEDFTRAALERLVAGARQQTAAHAAAARA